MLPVRVKQVLDALFTKPGLLEPDLRRAAAARAAAPRAAEDGLPPALAGWIDKVALHAYRCTDEDVAALKQAGFSEDQIYEATVAAALGAGVARFERGLALLRGGQG